MPRFLCRHAHEPEDAAVWITADFTQQAVERFAERRDHEAADRLKIKGPSASREQKVCVLIAEGCWLTYTVMASIRET